MPKLEMVVGFAFSEDEKRILLLRKTHPEWQKGKFNGVGGKLGTKEEKNKGMVREFLEETKISIRFWRHFATINGPEYILYCFTAHLDDETLDKIPVQNDVEEDFYIRSVRDLFHQDDYIPNLYWLIPMALDPAHIFANIDAKNY